MLGTRSHSTFLHRCSHAANLAIPKHSAAPRAFGYQRTVVAARSCFARFFRTGGFTQSYPNDFFLAESASNVANTNEVAVFWDLNDCTVPDELDPYRVGPNIVLALRVSGFNGPIVIKAYGNTRQFNEHDLLQALIATGVDLHHVPGGQKDSNNRMLVDLLLWVRQRSPPAHMFLISGDKDFSSVLHKLLMRGYNVLWAYPHGGMSPVLLNAASKVWAWDGIVKGIGLLAKSCINGTPINSGRWKSFKNVSQGCLTPRNKQDCHPQVEDKSEISFHEKKKRLHAVPQEVVEQVINIVRMKPKGFTVGGFKRQIGRSNLILDKSLYGHKDLLSFLLSIPALRASLVWTSDRSRTYVFTVDDAKSTNMPGVNERVFPSLQDRFTDRTDDSLSSHEASRIIHSGAIVEELSQVAGPIGTICDSQKRDSASRNEKWEHEHTPNFLPETPVKEQATAHQGIESESRPLSLANRGVLKMWKNSFHFWQRILQILGLKDSNSKLQDELLGSKDLNHKCGKKTVEEGMLVKKDRDIGTSIVSNPSEMTLERLGDEKWKGKVHSLKKSAQRQSNNEFVLSEVRQCELSEDDIVEGQQHRETNILASPQEGATFRREILNKVVSKKLWKEIELFVTSVEGRSAIGKIATVEDMVQLLRESNLAEVARLQEKQLFQLAKLLTEDNKCSHSVLIQYPEVDDVEKNMQCVTATDCDLLSKGELERENVIAANTNEADNGFGWDSGDFEATNSTKLTTDSATLARDVGLTHMPMSDTELSVYLDSNATVSSLEHFKNWVEKVLCCDGSTDRQAVLQKFQDLQDYGFWNVNDLINRRDVDHSLGSSDSFAVIAAESKGRNYHRESIVRDLKEVLQDILQSYKHGFPLCDLKEAFKMRYGYDLDNKNLGHKSLRCLVCAVDNTATISKDSMGQYRIWPKFSVPMENSSAMSNQGAESIDGKIKSAGYTCQPAKSHDVICCTQ